MIQLINSIVPFDMLVDVDMGVIKYVQVSSQGNNLYYPGIMEMIDSEFTPILESICVHRKFSNPLSGIIEQSKLLTCEPDKLLDSFFSSKEIKELILKMSTNTAIFDIVSKSLFIQNALRFTVLCKDELEKEELLRRLRKIYNTQIIPLPILVDEKKNVCVDDYGNFYIKSVYDIDEYQGTIEGKNIIIGNYTFNKEYNVEREEYDELPILDIIDKYTECNKIQFIDIYPVSIEDEAVG